MNPGASLASTCTIATRPRRLAQSLSREGSSEPVLVLSDSLTSAYVLAEMLQIVEVKVNLLERFVRQSSTRDPG
jgi:hypothetical protein